LVSECVRSGTQGVLGGGGGGGGQSGYLGGKRPIDLPKEGVFSLRRLKGKKRGAERRTGRRVSRHRRCG